MTSGSQNSNVQLTVPGQVLQTDKFSVGEKVRCTTLSSVWMKQQLCLTQANDSVEILHSQVTKRNLVSEMVSASPNASLKYIIGFSCLFLEKAAPTWPREDKCRGTIWSNQRQVSLGGANRCPPFLFHSKVGRCLIEYLSFIHHSVSIFTAHLPTH